MPGARIRSVAALTKAPGGAFPLGEQAYIQGPVSRGFATPNVDTSAHWQRLDWRWVNIEAQRARQHARGVVELPDLIHDIALEAVQLLALGATDMRATLRRARHVVEERYAPKGWRPQSSEALFSGARLTPGEWRAFYAFLRRTLKGNRLAILEATCNGESLAIVADRLGITRRAATVCRSHALARCRAALAPYLSASA